MRLREVLRTKQPIDAEPTFGMWFRHESPYDLDVLKPLPYEQLKVVRPEYDVDGRKSTEDKYRELVKHEAGTSFLYATIVGYNKMEKPEEYPGFTYYFQLSQAEIEKCVFDIVDAQPWMSPTRGHSGLMKAISLWEKHKGDFSSFDDPELGDIDPRIEVIIPFAVKPEFYFPQIEDRH